MVAELMLDNKPNVNAKANNGQATLMHALGEERKDIAQLLTAYGTTEK